MKTITKEELKRVLNLHKKWAAGKPDGKCADFAGANLQGANLSGYNLVCANLSNADLSFAELRGTCLAKADLGSACLKGADLRYANLAQANLEGVNLLGVNLAHAILEPFLETNNQQPTTNMDNTNNNETTVPKPEAKEEVKKNVTFGHELLDKVRELRKRHGNLLRINVYFKTKDIEVIVERDKNGMIETLLSVAISRKAAAKEEETRWCSSEHYICYLLDNVAFYADSL